MHIAVCQCVRRDIGLVMHGRADLREGLLTSLCSRQGYDLHNRTVSLQSQNGSSSAPQQLHYDLLIAADGVGSKVCARPLCTAGRQC